jgi:tetratricopeptide (TPR) repeat protein
MLTASPITSQPVGKTFSIAIGVLGVGAVLQLVLIGWAFVNKAHMPIATAVPAAVTLAHLSTGAAPAAASLDLNANPMTEPPQTQTTAAASAVPPKPTPVTNKPPTADSASRFDELVLQGKELRDGGDMSRAITKFREAVVLDGKSPVPLNELATTYEKMGLADKAAENWRKIYEMGDSAGIYYQVAEAKLKASQANALRHVAEVPQTPETPVDNSAAIDGVAAGAVLGLLQVTAEEERDDNSAKRFVLHIPIKARPKAHIEVRDLVIHVLFYDIVDGQNVVQTSANVNSRWATPPADWADSDTEELAVEYQLPKLEARAAKRENRKYFGYIVRIYYKQQLQAAAAEPDRLAQQYPPPPTLPKENEK